MAHAPCNSQNASRTSISKNNKSQSRAFTIASDSHRDVLIGVADDQEVRIDVRFGSKADMCSAQADVRFVPIADKSLSCGFDPPSSFRVLQRFVILLGLPRVARRKLGERVIKGVALAAIACNHRRVACLGVRQRQCPAAKAAVIWKRLNIVDRIAALHVRKLTDIELPSFDLAPTEEDIGRTLGETLAEDHTVSLVLEWQLEVNIRSQNGWVGFLDLKEERIVVVDTLKQNHPARGTDTPDPHHFAGHVDDVVARKQNPTIVAQRIDVRAQKTIEVDFDRVPLSV